MPESKFLRAVVNVQYLNVESGHIWAGSKVPDRKSRKIVASLSCGHRITMNEGVYKGKTRMACQWCASKEEPQE